MSKPKGDLELPPTFGQTHAIARMCMALGIREELEHTPKTRREARSLMYDLWRKLNKQTGK